jgi:hypothetical protein
MGWMAELTPVEESFGGLGRGPLSDWGVSGDGMVETFLKMVVFSQPETLALFSLTHEQIRLRRAILRRAGIGMSTARRRKGHSPSVYLS